MFIMPSAYDGGFAGFDIMDQFCLGSDILLQDRITQTDTGSLVGITAADAGKVIFAGKAHGAHIGICVFTCVVPFYKVKFLIDKL